jgi:hypothetical protein
MAASAVNGGLEFAFRDLPAHSRGSFRVVNRTLIWNLRISNIARDSTDGIVSCMRHVEQLGPHWADFGLGCAGDRPVSQRSCAVGYALKFEPT